MPTFLSKNKIGCKPYPKVKFTTTFLLLQSPWCVLRALHYILYNAVNIEYYLILVVNE